MPNGGKAPSACAISANRTFRASMPRMVDGTFVLYVTDRFLGLPYKVLLSAPAEPPDYDPLPLTPYPRPSAPTGNPPT